MCGELLYHKQEGELEISLVLGCKLENLRYIEVVGVDGYLKCQRLFRPKFSKFKTSFFVENQEVSDTLTLNVGVSDDTPV